MPLPIISFDASSTGSYFLLMVREAFDYPCLYSDSFEALADAFSNDLAKHCFQPLANLISADGLELWQVDCAEDTVHMAVLPTEGVEAFKVSWTEGFQADPEETRHFMPQLRRIQPTNAAPARSANARRTLAVEIVDLPAEPDIDIDRGISLLRSPYSDHTDNGTFFDFSRWPPVKLPLPGFAENADFARRWRHLHRDGERDIWTCMEPKGGGAPAFKLARIDDLQAWTPAWLCDGASIPGHDDGVKWMCGQAIHVCDKTDAHGKPAYEVLGLSAGASECWYGSRKELHVFPFGDAARCVIVDGDAHIAIAEGPITAADFLRLPKPLYDLAEGVIALGGETVVFFTGTKSHLRMHRLDFATMAHDTCLLKHFGHSGMARGTPYSTFGNLGVRQGHGDWWILNHKSNQFGKIDIALFWNAVTDETFVIGQGDIKLDQPTVIYQRGLGRYLAVRGESVALLPEFDALAGGREKVTLQWERA
ncbi:hypothetical protein [Pseudoduganella albidiflava]|uniref:Uncharacterized protein n=1 Tax=Pseudoduganella albidiflava TaxID=321983 RepID=A0A411X158_9BURK|nr:hypothetical protein [Pseudoduganella albidiflava]QBI02716.1 hypothetical protein EYF70_19080 [Pseudoduganella albidiflava]GGY68474.1 hypothetical protein GCM10007387_58200 [Pseudoduganella albidiflava]